MSARSRRRWCSGQKIRHQTYQTAADHAAALTQHNARRGLVRPGQSLGVYFCEVCEAFHIGHQKAETRADGLPGNEEVRTVSLPPPGPDRLIEELKQ